MNTIHTLAKKSSRKQVPAMFKKIPWVKGERNLDIGGGKYETATEWLWLEHRVNNMVLDKFNRSKEHNDAVEMEIMRRGNHGNRKKNFINTITLANVLNVIPDRKERINLLSSLNRYASSMSTTVYISCYNASGQPSVSECQTCMKLQEYLPEINEVFNNWVHNKPVIEIKDDMIIIHPRNKQWKQQDLFE